MLGQNGDAIEDPLGGRVRFGELKLDGRCVQFFNRDRLPADDQKISLRRMNLLIEMKAKGEDDIVSAERMPIGKTQSATERERVLEPIGRHLPSLRQCRNGLL